LKTNQILQAKSSADRSSHRAYAAHLSSRKQRTHWRHIEGALMQINSQEARYYCLRHNILAAKLRHVGQLHNAPCRYTCLTVGDAICVYYNNRKYFIDVVEAKPAAAISVIDTDCEVPAPHQ
jgi:Ubiquitin fusion degradation protein UFD1